MGILVEKDEENSKLTEKINADLRARAQETSQISDPDLVEGSEYVKDTEKTGKYSWVWFVLIVLAILSLIFIILI